MGERLELKSLVNNASMSERQAQMWLKSALFKEVLGSDTSHKSLFIRLEQPSGEQGVFLLNKSIFSENNQDIIDLINSAKLKELSKNDIFGNYEVQVDPQINTIQSQLIYPANEKIIAKYRKEEKFIIKETAEDYKTITLEFIQSCQLNLTVCYYIIWVYNLLAKQAEAERIIFEDPDIHNGFILSPDIKWDGINIENLYVLAIIHRRGVKSIRDLTSDDLPLLENIRNKSLAAIREKYDVRSDQIRSYFHYQPSFYHLHVHFVNLKYDAPASSTLSAVLLDDVINNLYIAADYYKKATLSFSRKKSDKLLQMYRDAGRCQE
uniref:m7GpppX diphosphatase n=1 Tax=Heterorhabditis bacteriophora TaxID=37862 RepID=A0A1I7XLC2_HETBA